MDSKKPKVTMKAGDWTCFICKRQFSGLMEFVDHCPDQTNDYNLQCNNCAKVTEAAARGDVFAKWLFDQLLKRDKSTYEFVKNWKPRS